MLRFAAGLLGILTSSSLATSLRQQAAPPASSRKCNVQESQGTRFLVDNSKLQAKTRGLSFRITKDHQARDPQTVALWGSEVIGLDEGDGWVRVGDCFLPLHIKDTPILLPFGTEASEAKADLSQLQAAKTRPSATLSQGKETQSSEAQLRAALAEAAEVTQAVAGHLKAEKEKTQELEAQLAKLKSSGDGGLSARLSQLEPKWAEARKAGTDQQGCAAEVENARKEFEEEMAELKEQAEVLSQANTELQEKAQQREMDRVKAEKRVLEVEGMNRELTRRLEKVSLEAKYGKAQNSAAAVGAAEEEMINMHQHRDQLQATLDEMIASAQQTSIENAENLNHLYKKIKSLKKQLAEAHEREDSLRAAANTTANATATATANATGAAAANATGAAHRLGTLGAVAGQAGSNSTKAVVVEWGTAGSAEVLDLQARLQSSERKSKELAAQVKKVQAQSDQFLVMAGTQVKDIQAKLLKNNHTFQLRFEACERRNTALSENCDVAKQQLRDEVRRLGGHSGEETTSNASDPVVNEAGPSANASAELLLGKKQLVTEKKATAQASLSQETETRSLKHEASKVAIEDSAQSHSGSTAVDLPLSMLALLLTVLPAVC